MRKSCVAGCLGPSLDSISWESHAVTTQNRYQKRERDVTSVLLRDFEQNPNGGGKSMLGVKSKEC